MDTKNDLLFNHSLIKVVRIIGCDYKLRESEILDWLVQFGELSSEITEEAYGDVEAQDTMNIGQEFKLYVAVCIWSINISNL